jgi:hypothetical protein
MLRSRVFRRLPFKPPAREQVPTLTRGYHPIYAQAEEALLLDVDDADVPGASSGSRAGRGVNPRGPVRAQLEAHHGLVGATLSNPAVPEAAQNVALSNRAAAPTRSRLLHGPLDVRRFQRQTEVKEGADIIDRPAPKSTSPTGRSCSRIPG